MSFERTIEGVRVPAFLYGTAWKEERTRGLVEQALAAGFSGIDTANQRKHYHEAGVGEALRAAKRPRESLFIQTKFTHLGGQDHRLPYEKDAPVATQVRQSCARSLEHLGIERIDSLVLHGPSVRDGLAPEDTAAWEAMEEVRAAGQTRLLGVSNVNKGQLELLIRRAKAPISFVQNRCYARTGWDRGVREVCNAHGIVYQGFSLLTANSREMAKPELLALAKRVKLTPSQLVFRFALQVGMLPLTGTSDPVHMREDLAVANGPALSDADVRAIESIGG